MNAFTIFYAPQYVAIEEIADFKWEDLRGKRFSVVRWHTYINVNYGMIVILCNWVDGLNSPKNLVSSCT